MMDLLGFLVVLVVVLIALRILRGLVRAGALFCGILFLLVFLSKCSIH
jgi:hypothetical protein